LCLILPRAVTGPEVVRAAREGRATIIVGVPRLYEALVKGVMDRIDALGFPARQAVRLLLAVSRLGRIRLGVRLGSVLLRGLHRRIGPELDIMASGGAPLEPELAWTMEALGWRVAIGYGLTETSPILTINPPGAGKFHSVGRPLPGVELRIVDADKKGEDARGGEIQARGPGVFSGYRNLPDKTEEAFDEGGWYKTGDLGRMEDGWLVVNGRVSTLIVTSGGENVQPDALEQVLDRHSLLKESGVLERDGKVAALVRPDASAARRLGLEPEEAARKAVREAAESMPSYARPTAVAVTMHAIERTRLGKIRRHKLEDHFERAIQGADEQAREPMHPQEMQTEDRRLLEHDAAATAWELLAKRYPNRRLTPDSELAGDLGVDSLEWLDLTMELGAKAGVELDEEQIASIRTVRDLLRTVTSLESGRGQGPDPVREPEDYLADADTRWLEPVTGWRLVCFRTMHAAFGPLARLLFRVRVHGLEHLDREGPLVITPNHLSYLDPILLAAALPFPLLRRTHFIGGQGTAFANPLLSFFSSTAQTIPIDPGRRPGASLALGSSVLSRGRNLVWFPEGLRSRTGELARFQPGLGRILAFRDALVVPVHIAGTYEAMPPGRWWIKPVQVSFTIGEPVAASTLRQDGECGEDESVADCVTASLRRRMERMAQ
jgi:long-chain acyl-CoA synthetase